MVVLNFYQRLVSIKDNKKVFFSAERHSGREAVEDREEGGISNRLLFSFFKGMRVF